MGVSDKKSASGQEDGRAYTSLPVCETYASFEELSGQREEWDRVVLEAQSGIFLTYDACRVWWNHYGRKRDLRVFLFRDAGRLVGIMPLFFERIWLGPVSVRVGKIVGSDFTLSQFGLPIVAEHLTGVVARFCELISKQKWDFLYIGPLAGLYSHVDTLRDGLLASLGTEYSVEERPMEVQTYFELPGSWEEYLMRLKSKQRYKIKKRMSDLREVLKEQPGELTAEFATPRNCAEMFDGFVRMHQEHWQKLGKRGHFGDWPGAQGYHSEMARTQLACDRLRLTRISWGSVCLGYEYSYKCDRMYQTLLNARLDSELVGEAGVGPTLFAEQARQAMSEGARYIDSMRGRYDYKLELGGKLFPIKCLYVLPRHRLKQGRIFLFRLLARALDACYYKLWYCRLAPRLGIDSGCLWRAWIRSCGLAR